MHCFLSFLHIICGGFNAALNGMCWLVTMLALLVQIIDICTDGFVGIRVNLRLINE